MHARHIIDQIYRKRHKLKKTKDTDKITEFTKEVKSKTNEQIASHRLITLKKLLGVLHLCRASFKHRPP